MALPLKYFAELTDPRVERNREHLLEEILLIAIAAVLSWAESWNGIALYGTRETGKKQLVHMVSAWAESNGLVLGQRKVDEKSNEITAIPRPGSPATGLRRRGGNCWLRWNWLAPW